MFLFPALARCPVRPLTHASIIEHARKHQHDVVGPVFAVQWHLILFDHQQVQVADALHGVKEVQKSVLVATAGGGEDRALDHIQILLKGKKKKRTRGQKEKLEPLDTSRF